MTVMRFGTTPTTVLRAEQLAQYSDTTALFIYTDSRREIFVKTCNSSVIERIDRKYRLLTVDHLGDATENTVHGSVRRLSDSDTLSDNLVPSLSHPMTETTHQ